MIVTIDNTGVVETNGSPDSVTVSLPTTFANPTSFSSLSTTTNIAVSGTLVVSGTSQLTGSVGMNGTLIVSGTSQLTGSVGMNGTLIVSGTTTNNGFLVVSGGIGLSDSGLSMGIAPFPLTVTNYISQSVGGNNITMVRSQLGSCTLSGTAGVPLVLALPQASSVPGGYYVLRNLDTTQHIISASNDTGNKVCAAGAVGHTGTKVTFPAIANSSVKLESDGFNWGVYTISGSASIS